MPIELNNIRPASIVMNIRDVRTQVDFVAESKDLVATDRLLRRPTGLFGYVKRFFQPNKVDKKPLTMVFATEGIGHKAPGAANPVAAPGLSDEQFSDYCNLVREVVNEAVPRMHGYGDIPEREACADELPVPPSLKSLHARVIWTKEELIALCYAANFGSVLYLWANKYHRNSNFPAACRALWDDVIVVVPKFWVIRPRLKAALIDARGVRYRR